MLITRLYYTSKTQAYLLNTKRPLVGGRVLKIIQGNVLILQLSEVLDNSLGERLTTKLKRKIWGRRCL